MAALSSGWHTAEFDRFNMSACSGAVTVPVHVQLLYKIMSIILYSMHAYLRSHNNI